MCVYKVIADYYGLKLGEVFKVENSSKETYDVKITETGLFYKSTYHNGWLPSSVTLQSLLDGECTIVRLPFKPKIHEKYYYIFRDTNGYNWGHASWSEGVWDFARALDYGVYRTEAEAIKKVEELTNALNRAMEEL